jgi:hypothetical protein
LVMSNHLGLALAIFRNLNSQYDKRDLPLFIFSKIALARHQRRST